MPDFQLHLSRYELRENGRVVRLERQPMDLLILLAQKPGELVTREEIAEKFWGKNVFVEADHGINNMVRKLRVALRDDTDNPRFLETVVGKGYRLVGPIEVIARPQAQAESLPAAQAAPVEASQAQRPQLTGPVTPVPAAKKSNAWKIVATAALLVALVVGWQFLMHRSQAAYAGRARFHTLVVLPFENLSAEPGQDYFADGVTDELTTELAKDGSFQVISRTSARQYHSVHQPLAQIAKDLGADVVVEGSVVRSGNRVRVTAQLIEAATDHHLWAETYERDLGELISIQDSVAAQIAQRIQASYSSTSGAKRVTHKNVAPAAYDAYLRGRHFLTLQNADALKKALAEFQTAIDLEPTYAPAHAGLADTFDLFANYYVMPPKEAFPLAEAAAAKSLAIDETLAEPHASLGFARHHFDWDWAGAEKEYKRALELSPSYSTAHLRYADLLSSLGRHDEAIAEIRKAQELDPLSLVIGSNQGRLLYNARRYDEAIETLRKNLDLDPKRGFSHLYLGMAYEQKNSAREAEEEFNRATALLNFDYNLSLAHLYAATGRRAEAKKILDLANRAEDREWFFTAGVSAALGDKDEAFRRLEKAYEERDFFLVTLKISQLMDPLRNDPRYAAQLARVHLSAAP